MLYLLVMRQSYCPVVKLCLLLETVRPFLVVHHGCFGFFPFFCSVKIVLDVVILLVKLNMPLDVMRTGQIR